MSLDLDLRFFLDGGREKSLLRDLASECLCRDSVFGSDQSLGDETKDVAMRRIRRLVEMLRGSVNDQALADAILAASAEVSDSLSMRLGVHSLLFRAAVSFFGTDDQRDAWMPDILNYNVLGSFAMTELGHSSSLRDIETTATLDMTNDEWVLHSPTLTSTKWWMGMVGHTATHTALLAKTMVNGSNIGLNWFLVRLRQNGRLLPGVTCGDLGAKAGRHGLDNGFIQLTCMRIPRTDMLSRHCTVERDGTTDGPAHPAVMYATLIPERLAIAFAGPRQSVGRALTVAARSVVANSRWDDDIVSMLAKHYTVILAEPPAMRHWQHMLDLSSSNVSAYADLLPDLHATSAGLKAVNTWWGGLTISRCLKMVDIESLQGRFIKMLSDDWGVMTTGGGDNFPMIQQCARYVMQSLATGLNGRQCQGSSFYLSHATSIPKTFNLLASASEGWDTLESYLSVFSSFVVVEGQRLAAKIADEKRSGAPDPWDTNAVELAAVATFHTHHHLCSLALKHILTAQQDLQPLLTDCVLRCAMDFTVDSAADLIAAGVMTAEQIARVRVANRVVRERIRGSLTSLVDGLGFKDFVLVPASAPRGARRSPDELIYGMGVAHARL